MSKPVDLYNSTYGNFEKQVLTVVRQILENVTLKT